MISQSIAMDMKGIPEILAFCVCWLIQKGEKVKNKDFASRLVFNKAEEKRKETAVSVMSEWLLYMLKSITAFKLHKYV